MSPALVRLPCVRCCVQLVGSVSDGVHMPQRTVKLGMAMMAAGGCNANGGKNY